MDFHRFLNKIRSFLEWNLESLASHASRGLEMASRSLKMAFQRQLGPNLSPSWLQVASRWAQVGSMLAQVGPSWAQDRPREGPGGSPSAFQEGPGRVPVAPGAQKALRAAPGTNFWSIFDRFLMILGPILGRVFDHFLIFLGGSFWSFWSQVLLITWLKGSGLTVKCLGLPTLTLNPKYFTLNH